jgi:hypothetical protein
MLAAIEAQGSAQMKRDILPLLVRWVGVANDVPTLLTHLSRDPSKAFTAGQWMTEVGAIHFEIFLRLQTIFSGQEDLTYLAPRQSHALQKM